jgi:hypothetical protein
MKLHAENRMFALTLHQQHLSAIRVDTRFIDKSGRQTESTSRVGKRYRYFLSAIRIDKQSRQAESANPGGNRYRQSLSANRVDNRYRQIGSINPGDIGGRQIGVMPATPPREMFA